MVIAFLRKSLTVGQNKRDRPKLRLANPPA